MTQPPEYPPPPAGDGDDTPVPGLHDAPTQPFRSEPPAAPAAPAASSSAPPPPPAGWVPPATSDPAASAPAAPGPQGTAPMAGQPPRRTGPAGGLFDIDAERLPAVLVAVGVALVSAGVVVSSAYARKSGSLDWSNFIVGVLATLALLIIAGGAHVLSADAEQRATLVSWPGAFGAIATGLMINVAVTNDDVAAYVSAVVIIGLSVGGYLLVRRAPFVLSTIVGLALLYSKLFSDIFDTHSTTGDNTPMKVGFGILVFVVVVTAAGWLLPETRVLSGVVVGIGGLVAMVTLLVIVIALRLFAVAFATPDFSSGDLSGGSDLGSFSRHDPYKNDVYVILVLCLVLAALWVGAALLTGHVGFKLLLVGDAVSVIPLSTLAVMTHHPTWWGAVPALIGGIVLVLVGLMILRGPGGRGGSHQPDTSQSSPGPWYQAPTG